MIIVLSSFLVISVLVWLSFYGYLSMLCGITLKRRKKQEMITSLPEIGVLVPALNEEDLIRHKIADIKKSDYPFELMTVVIVDGKSVDRTNELVREEIESNDNLLLLSPADTRGKADQVKYGLRHLEREIVIVTDVDSDLDPSCVRELVNKLVSDPEAAIVGAAIKPDTELLEERIHWWFLNFLWWLEGEALSSANISGVCYACRRKFLSKMNKNAKAEDIHLSRLATSRGFRVRICRKGVAVEKRVPRSAKEFIRYRRRRGAAFLHELLRCPENGRENPGSRIVRFMWMWHFMFTPKAWLFLIFTFPVLFFSAYHWLVSSIFGMLFVSGVFVLFGLYFQSKEKVGAMKLLFAASRLFFLWSVSVLRLDTGSIKQGPVGGKK